MGGERWGRDWGGVAVKAVRAKCPRDGLAEPGSSGEGSGSRRPYLVQRDLDSRSCERAEGVPTPSWGIPPCRGRGRAEVARACFGLRRSPRGFERRPAGSARVLGDEPDGVQGGHAVLGPWRAGCRASARVSSSRPGMRASA